MKFSLLALLVGGSLKVGATLITSGHCVINTVQGGGLICGKEGAWSQASGQQLRQFPSLSSNNQTFCMDECVSDFYCYAVSHNSTSKMCTTFSQSVKDTDFIASTTSVTYWNKKCIRRHGFCGVHNPSFEFGVRGTPRGSSYNGTNQQSAQLIPWSFGTLETTGYSFAKLIRNKHPPNGKNYLQMVVAKGTGPIANNVNADGIGQYVTLVPGQNYTLYYSYRAISFTGDTGTEGSYLVQTTMAYNYIDSAPIDMSTAVTAGWQKRIVGFVSTTSQSDPNSPNLGTQFLQIAFGTPNATDPASKAVFGIDDVFITRGTPSSPGSKVMDLESMMVVPKRTLPIMFPVSG